MPEAPMPAAGLIAVAMSGGVDSSTVVALLKREGHNLAGLTMQLWNQRRLPALAGGDLTGRCCSLDDVYDARRVAEQVGVPYYVDAQLADPDLDDWRKPFLGGLAVLNRQMQKLYGHPFHECSLEEQDQQLAKWQAGKSGESRFFQVLMNLTVEGAFGDPSHGGNKSREQENEKKQ